MENVLLIPTASAEAGRSVLQVLDDLAAANVIEVRAAAVVERQADGRWRVPEETENITYRGSISGGAVGALIGLLGGPAGMLLGGAAGFVVGSSVEIGDAQEAQTIVQALPRLVPPGTTAVVGDLYERDPVGLDRALLAFGVNAWRMTRAEAEAQLDEAIRRSEEQAERLS